ncbi:Ig-like domain-containing protein, partial [Vibrio cholerae]
MTFTNGSTTTLTETIAPANATNQNVTWSSSDDAI